MSIALLALVGIIFLLGLVAFGLGTQGWSWGTVAAAFLVLLSAVAFVYFAGRVGERERIWREKVRSLQDQIAQARDAQAPGRDGTLAPVPGQQPLASLKADAERWKRANERSQAWRGQFWEGGTFQPPRPAKEGQDAVAGTLQFELADEESDPPLTAGSQVYVFDQTSVEEGGRYLGAFRVEASRKDGDQFRLQVVPALPVSPADAALWSKSYDTVTAFEQLPSDSWLTFSRTAQPAKEEGGEAADDADEASASDIIPPTRKLSAEQLLEQLEARLAEVEKDGKPVPEDEWRPLVDEKKIRPGLYWATVEFTEPHAVAAPPGAKDAADREPAQFEAGDMAEFDLETAAGLVEAKVAEIKEVIYRRPLIDAGTAIQGAMIKTGGDAAIEARGLLARREALEKQLAEIKATLTSLATGLEKTAATIKTLEQEQTELTADVGRWRQDADVAAEVASAFDKRLQSIREALDDAWQTVIQWGREYDGSMALLQADLDKRAPPPR